MKSLKIGLFGFGCVGGGLYEVLNKTDNIQARIEKIVVKDRTKKRALDATFFSYEKDAILGDTAINVVVELIDDADAAFEIVKKALQKGKHVVTANKKMLALYLDQLLPISVENNVALLYEASVCGSIPIIRNLEEYYNNDLLQSISSINNGTCNYILSQLFQTDQDFNTILKKAQKSGFAESDPSLDIDGFDSKYKLQLLVLHAFGVLVPENELLNVGIRNIPKDIIHWAQSAKKKIRLLATAQKEDSGVRVFVLPTLVNEGYYAFSVEQEFNAVALEAAFSDKQVLIGKGAGSHPTASAVLSDIAALKYDYTYQYHKKQSVALKYNPNARIKVIAYSKDPDILASFPKESKLDIDLGLGAAAQVYEMKISAIKALNAKNYPEVFWLYCPEEIFDEL